MPNIADLSFSRHVSRGAALLPAPPYCREAKVFVLSRFNVRLSGHVRLEGANLRANLLDGTLEMLALSVQALK
jgi:hypothetical protein